MSVAADGPGAPGTPSDDRRHTEHGRERKQQLVDAAAELFAANGYAATRIQDICRRAGVAKGLFYWYFPTKQELFAELVRSMRLRLRKAQAAAMDPDADPLTRDPPGHRGQRPLQPRPRRLLLAARRRARPTPATPPCCARAARSTCATSWR